MLEKHRNRRVYTASYCKLHIAEDRPLTLQSLRKII